ncbi:nucleoside diphosphatase [Scheffersomyces coipomensis]|uniref:nucleoside diphosphatase n=1 Tax=Scheffersomyces coipomensis TaxID=1788519 RepID=UPI00315D419C
MPTIDNLEVRKTKKKKDKNYIKPGPIYSDQDIPYDYMVIIDAGSSGSRVYVYNWLNPEYSLKQDYELTKAKGKLPANIELFKQFTIKKDDESESEGESDNETENGNEINGEDKTIDDSDNVGNIDESNQEEPTSPKKSLVDIKFPKIKSKKKWHQKIKPGISSFNQSPQKIGNHHIKYLLTLASSVVPKSQHYRTPIFLHSTAGMRLLTPTQQQQILTSICNYITNNSDFYIPECSSHINVIDGDFEGIYGWLAINSLKGSFDHPELHNHGKSHYTYGLLDMGGASTQVVFQPNVTEIEEHQKSLYRINLNQLPQLTNSTSEDESEFDAVGSYYVPNKVDFNIYSDSFLGFGMYQAHTRYLESLFHIYLQEHGLNDHDRYYGNIGKPIVDPCLPKGYTTTAVLDDYSVDFTGGSDFPKCLEMIFPVISNSTHGTLTGGDNVNCKQFNEQDQVSSCLLNDLIPSFDFDINHFVGVSGYWEAINNLLSYDEATKRDDNEEEDDEDDDESDDKNESADTYDYKIIYKETTKLCSQSFSSLIELNKLKSPETRLSEEELAELCFKSSWVLNFLHLGLGFPRFGIDDEPSQINSPFKSLQLVEELDGSAFSWTLGRAILYANDEYVQAFNNYTLSTLQLEQDSPRAQDLVLRRPGLYYSAAPSVYHFGAEQNGIYPRPQFTPPDKDAKYHHYDYETNYKSDSKESKWYIEPHRWYGIFIFMFLLGFIGWLMLGRNGRSLIFDKLRIKLGRFMIPVFGNRNKNQTYMPVKQNQTEQDDLENAAGFELDELSSEDSKPGKSSSTASDEDDIDRQFKIDSDDDE